VFFFFFFSKTFLFLKMGRKVHNTYLHRSLNIARINNSYTDKETYLSSSACAEPSDINPLLLQ